MTNSYQVTLNTPQYNVVVGGDEQYSIGLNYEPPSKGIQYQNLIIDDLSSQFDCVRNTFDLSVAGVHYSALNDQQLIISVNNVILQPGVGYTVSGNQITFATPPCNVPFFGIALANTADLTRTINYVVDNGSSPMTIGNKGYLTIDVSGIIESWVLLSDQPGNLVVDIEKSSFADYPNTVSICGSSRPFLTNQNKNSNSNLSDWNTIITAGDVLSYEVINTSTSISRFSIGLKVKL